MDNNFIDENDKVKSDLIYQSEIHKANPFLSILIPTYKRGEYLDDAISSALRQIDVDVDYEVIVVNNDPLCDMTDLIEKYRHYDISFYRNKKNLGMCGNINRCAKLANAKYVAYLHDDDLLLPSYIKEVVDIFKAQEDIDCLIPARYRLFGTDKLNKKKHKRDRTKHVLLSTFAIRKIFSPSMRKLSIKDIILSGRNCFVAPSCGTAFKRDALFEWGGFNTAWKYAFDLILFQEFCKNYNVYAFNRTLGIYRMVVSASHNPIVQFEFFEAEKNIANSMLQESKFAQLFYNEYIFLNYKSRSDDAKKLIINKYGESVISNCNVIKFIMFRFINLLYYSFSNLDLEKYLSPNVEKDLSRMFGGRN